MCIRDRSKRNIPFGVASALPIVGFLMNQFAFMLLMLIGVIINTSRSFVASPVLLASAYKMCIRDRYIANRLLGEWLEKGPVPVNHTRDPLCFSVRVLSGRLNRRILGFPASAL